MKRNMCVIYRNELIKNQLKGTFQDSYNISYYNSLLDFETKITNEAKKINVIIVDANYLKTDDLRLIYKLMHMSSLINSLFIGFMESQIPKTEEILFSLNFDEVVYESMTFETIKKRIQLAIHNKHMEHGIEDIYSGIIKTITKEWGLEGEYHLDSTRKYTKIMLKCIQKYHPEYLTDDDIEMISYASMLHDIGKIAVPYEILSKPGKLTNDEFEEIKKHTIYGCELLKNTIHKDSHFYRFCYDVCRYHHERWDGSGYPDKLKGNDIPIWAQVVGMMDIFEALTSDRVYEKAVEKNIAINMILKGECGSFSNEMFSYLKECRNDLLTVPTN